jgi:hypothetical protein
MSPLLTLENATDIPTPGIEQLNTSETVFGPATEELYKLLSGGQLVVATDFNHYEHLGVDNEDLRALLAMRALGIHGIHVYEQGTATAQTLKLSLAIRGKQTLYTPSLTTSSSITNIPSEYKIYQTFPSGNTGLESKKNFDESKKVHQPEILDCADNKREWANTGNDLQSDRLPNIIAGLGLTQEIESLDNSDSVTQFLTHFGGKAEGVDTLYDIVLRIAEIGIDNDSPYFLSYSAGASGLATVKIDSSDITRIQNLVVRGNFLEAQSFASTLIFEQLAPKQLTETDQLTMELELNKLSRGARLQEGVNGLDGREVSINFSFDEHGNIRVIGSSLNLVDPKDQGHYGNQVYSSSIEKIFQGSQVEGRHKEFLTSLKAYILHHHNRMGGPKPSKDNTLLYGVDIRFDDGGYPVITDCNGRPTGWTGPYLDYVTVCKENPGSFEQEMVYQNVGINTKNEQIDCTDLYQQMIESPNLLSDFFDFLLTRLVSVAGGYAEDVNLSTLKTKAGVILNSFGDAKGHILCPTVIARPKNMDEEMYTEYSLAMINTIKSSLLEFSKELAYGTA